MKKHWIDKIQLALDFKKDKFGNDAEDCMKFYNGPYTFMYGMDYRKNSSAFTYASHFWHSGLGAHLQQPQCSIIRSPRSFRPRWTPGGTVR